MANNRMFLKCSCGEEFMIAKYYPASSWYVPSNQGPEEFIDALTEWLGKHSECDEQCCSMWGPTHFKLEYEQEEGDDQERGMAESSHQL